MTESPAASAPAATIASDPANARPKWQDDEEDESVVDEKAGQVSPKPAFSPSPQAALTDERFVRCACVCSLCVALQCLVLGWGKGKSLHVWLNVGIL